jgi:carbon monoxide dehydrogenase subunit G
MKMSDTRQIAAPPSAVYAALLNPDVLKSCVPGATEVSGDPENGFEATVVQKVGPVKATFKGQVSLSNMVENESLTIDGEGKGGAAGFAKGGAQVRMSASDGGTELSYDVEAKVGGKLAQLGSRIIDGFAKKMADQFFSNLQQTLEGPAPEDADAATDVSSGEGAKDTAAKKSWLGRLKGKD